MPRTILAGFDKLRENLEITDLQGSTVSTRQKNVREALESDLTIHDSFLIGSYRRNTMISPLKEADVDIFVVLDSKYYSSGGQSSLLEKVKTVLLKTYKTPSISKNGQAVTMSFTDFRVDVVPAFYAQGGGYLIPDSSRGAWIHTDPKKHIEIWADANKDHDGELVPLMKMIKGWNQTRDLLTSFHLETIVLNVLTGIHITDYPSAVRFVFDKAQAKIRVKLPDPAGYSDDVGAHVNTEKQMDSIIKRLAWAEQKAREAEGLAANGNSEAAYAKWKEIFKDYFPSYR